MIGLRADRVGARAIVKVEQTLDRRRGTRPFLGQWFLEVGEDITCVLRQRNPVIDTADHARDRRGQLTHQGVHLLAKLVAES